MSEDLTPALTPEEWREKCFWADGQPYCSPMVRLDGDGLAIVDDDYYTGFTHYAERRHGVAALALHGQTFGFTHEDVALLMALADDYLTSDEEGGGYDERSRPLRHLANRIGLLLPPEDSR